MTLAETVAAVMGNDGRQFEAQDGMTLYRIVEIYGGHLRRPVTSDGLAYDFPDDSTIVVANGLWDIGFPGCYCWRYVGHTHTCEKEGGA